MAKSLEKLEGMAVRHAAALGRAEAALMFIASVADQPELVRQTALGTLGDINRIIARGESK